MHTLHDSNSNSISKTEFANDMAHALRTAGVTEPLIYNEKEFELLLSVESPSKQIRLVNIFNECCMVPGGERGEMIRDFATAVAESLQFIMPSDFADVRAHILPQIKTRAEMSLDPKNGGEEDSSSTPILAPLGDHLVVIPAYDMRRVIRNISQEETSTWSVTPEHLLATGQHNLRATSQASFVALQPGLYVSPWQDNWDAARVVLKDVIMGLDVKGDHVVMVPNRDHLLVTGADDALGLIAMSEVTLSLMDTPRFLSGIPLRMVSNAIATFKAPPTHPAHDALRHLWNLTMGREYCWQIPKLKKIHPQLFVADLQVGRKKNGSSITITIWTKGVHSLLPKADFIGLVQLDVENNLSCFHGLAPWGKVRNVMAHRMKSRGLYPERFEVNEFPTDAELARIGLTDPEGRPMKHPHFIEISAEHLAEARRLAND